MNNRVLYIYQKTRTERHKFQKLCKNSLFKITNVTFFFFAGNILFMSQIKNCLVCVLINVTM